MKGYSSKEAMAGHEYNMSAKHRKRESEGMKKYEKRRESSSKDDRIDTASKHTFGINTMSEDYDMSKVDVRPQTSRGQPPLAWDYDY